MTNQISPGRSCLNCFYMKIKVSEDILFCAGPDVKRHYQIKLNRANYEDYVIKKNVEGGMDVKYLRIRHRERFREAESCPHYDPDMP